ncbi:MAG: signal recognition particle-docking protein FtsY [Gammaproteobacteria bacterium]|nr:signal recognition particle-docking protein FtsY [Gammaproteobacteria bacterium]MBM4224370.1 signal recognition particle-docking protein FtsY [Gammaproteobacteria bacterium]MBM4230969.1 signal recognition particle-docking protein FtsY [Gammaproteobacteria bacterium]
MASESKPGFFQRLKDRLTRPGGGIGSGLARLFGARRIDDSILEELESRLLAADVGVQVTEELLDGLRKRVARQQLGDVDALLAALRSDITALLVPVAKPLVIDRSVQPYTILVVGVNGSGKTTTIGKLAHRYRSAGLKVMLAAGDTFRAAAVEQIGIWAERTGAELIAQQAGADPAAVAFDAFAAARSRGADILIADTAGRLQAQAHLMEELRKVRRVLGKADPAAPHEVLLVLDANQGQNALSQALQFHEAVGVTGLVLTKLDGTAKGGIVLAIARRLKLPIRFIGIGEGAEDFGEFDAAAFAAALIEGGSST